MKTNFLSRYKLLTIGLLAAICSNAQEWTWMKGGTSLNQYGTYGTQGTAATANVPGARIVGVKFKDNSGNLWVFGGGGYGSSQASIAGLSDLWKYDLSTSQWTWMKGP